MDDLDSLLDSANRALETGQPHLARRRANIAINYKQAKMRVLSSLVAASCISTFSVAWAEADGPDFYQVHGVATGHTLNLRAEPHVTAQILGRIQSGATCLRNQGCQGGLSFEEFTNLQEQEKRRRLSANPRWCKVEYFGKAGWVAGKYLAEGSCNEQQQAPATN